MGYFDTNHLIAPPITAGPSPSLWQSFTQGVSQQYHVDSAYSLDDEVQNRYLKSLRTYEEITGHKTNFPVDAEFLDDYIRTTQGSGPSYWHRNVFTGELGQRYQQYIDEFQRANEGIKALNRPDIPSMEQVLTEVSQMQHSIEAETERQSEAGGGVGAFIGRLAGGAVGSMTPRDPLNMATLAVGGFGKSVVTRLATEGAVQAGIAGATDVAFVNPNRQVVGLQPHSTMYDMLLAAAGGVALRGLGEAAHAGFRRFAGETPVVEPHTTMPTNDELRATLDTLPDSPQVRAGRSILDAVDDIERVNPYGDSTSGHDRFMEELRRVQEQMNGTADTAIARFLPPLPEVPSEHIESNFDFQLVREQAPDLYDRMQATRAAISNVEQQIADTEAGIASLSPSDAIRRIDEPSGELIKSYEQELQDPALTAERRADIERKVNTVVQTLGPENVQRELTNAAIKPKKELQSLRASRKAAVRRYKDAYAAVQAEADAIKNRQRIIALANNKKEVGAIVAGGQGRPFPPISIQAAKDIADVVEAADEAMPERMDALVENSKPTPADATADKATELLIRATPDGMIDIGLEGPVPGDRFFLDEGGQKVTFAKAMADLADDDRTAEAMRTCLL